MVLRPGFEPGSVAREATILNRTILPEPWAILLRVMSLSLAIDRNAVLLAVAHIFKARLN